MKRLSENAVANRACSVSGWRSAEKGDAEEVFHVLRASAAAAMHASTTADMGPLPIPGCPVRLQKPCIGFKGLGEPGSTNSTKHLDSCSSQTKTQGHRLLVSEGLPILRPREAIRPLKSESAAGDRTPKP